MDVVSLQNKIMMQAAPQPTTPSTYNNILETELEMKIMEVKYGDEVKFQPKLVSAGTDYNVYLTLPAYKVLYSQLGTDGDGMGDQAKFSKPPEQAVATMTLIQGAPAKVLRGGNPILESQKQAFDRIMQLQTDLVVAAFENDKVKCAGKDKARKKAAQKLKKGGKKPSADEIKSLAKEIYLEDAHHSGVKQMDWLENGEPKEGLGLKVKRKVRTVRYVTEKDDNGNEVRKRTLVPSNPVFHKPHIDGNYYEQTFGDYVPRDTLVAPRIRVEFFSNPMMYGSTIKMDKDVRILWMPKKKSKQPVASAMQYFSDGEEESPPKRKRDDEDDRDAKRAAH
tara:strand:- start:906 stop:1913 length:1008 start_codon:yes stop_codon:yes gene_type:complete